MSDIFNVLMELTCDLQEWIKFTASVLYMFLKCFKKIKMVSTNTGLGRDNLDKI